MNEWIDDLSNLSAGGNAAVVVTIAAIRGSAPREAGAKMIVTDKVSIGTIGGGQLEYECTRIAAGMLGSNAPPSTRRFPLGAAMGQCCGGVVHVLFELMNPTRSGWLEQLCAMHDRRQAATLVTRIGEQDGKFVVTAEQVFGPETVPLPDSIVMRARQMPAERAIAEQIDEYFLEAVVGSDFNVAVFGAGHVGTAVVSVLSKLDSNVRWIDSRRKIFHGVPKNVCAIEAQQPALEVAAMPAGSFYLVMTHSHALDFDICDSILRRRDAAYCGLIGSYSKRRRFEKRYAGQGMSRELIDALVCPIGVEGISGKDPAAIAIATAADILQVRERIQAGSRDYPDNVRPITL